MRQTKRHLETRNELFNNIKRHTSCLSVVSQHRVAHMNLIEINLKFYIKNRILERES